jgi:hypothetical protein
MTMFLLEIMRSARVIPVIDRRSGSRAAAALRR